ncbi:MAG: hypothetical protein MUF84_08985, partial [Anaerolineae bacterium]|nr:hypothetical protein [Anaerolineae bacterium]
DSAVRVWTAGEAGDQVTVWSGRASRIMGTESGWTPAGTISRALPYATVSERLITDGRGWSWLATSHDVRAFDGGRWRVFSPEEAGFTPSAEMVDMGFGFRFRDVAIDSTGDVWVSDCAWGGPGPVGQGARWYDGATWDGQTSSVVGSGCIEDIEVDVAGRIWLGINGDLWRYSPGEGWEQFTHPEDELGEDLRWGYIIDVVLGGEETAWVTMAPCGGASCDTGSYHLYRVRGGEWALMSSAGIADVAVDSSGNGWICVGNALYRVTAGEMAPAYDEGAFACRLESDGKRYTWLWQPDVAGLWIHDSLR